MRLFPSSFMCIFFLDLPLSLLAISVSLPNPPFYSNPPLYILLYIVYSSFLFYSSTVLSSRQVSIPLHRRRRSHRALNTPPPVAVPASQTSGSYSTPSLFFVHPTFYSTHSYSQEDGACYSLKFCEIVECVNLFEYDDGFCQMD